MTMNDKLRESLNRLAGTWRTEGRVVDGGEHHGETWSGCDIYEWFPGEQHLVHRVDVEIFGGRKEAMEFFTPRKGSADTFDQASFDGDGSVERAVGSFDSEGCYRNDSDHVRAVLTFNGSEAMHATWESRSSDGKWLEWMDVTFTRVADPHIEVRSKTDHTT